jgi:hypothetical protein
LRISYDLGLTAFRKLPILPVTSSERLPNFENAASTASACGWQYRCVIVIELCPAILARVNASQNGAMRVSAVWRIT